jgi:dihydroflavonol-4-reductase
LRVLVTGASGFVGGYMAEELTRRGHVVVAMVRKDSDTALLAELGVEMRVGDLTDRQSLEMITKGVDAVVHLAAYYSFKGSREKYELINVQGTQLLMDAMLKNGVHRLIYCSSTEAMGPTPKPPAHEDSPCEPIYEYGKSKLRAENLVREHQKKGIDFTIIRPSGIYGPRNLDDVSYWFITTFANTWLSNIIIGDGRKKVQFAHIEDVVQGFMLALEKPEVSVGRIYLITDWRAYSYDEVYAILASIIGKDPPKRHVPVLLAKALAAPVQAFNWLRRRPDFIWRIDSMNAFQVDRWYSIERAQKELGYRPKHDLAEGLKETVDWYKTNGFLK